MNLNRRTPEEIKAYIDGYNACNKQYRECLKQCKSVQDAVKEMDIFVAVVNGIVDKEAGNANAD